MADPSIGVDVAAVQMTAAIIHRCANIGADGFARQPAIRGAGERPGRNPVSPGRVPRRRHAVIGLGIEGATAAAQACTEAATLEEAGELIVARIEIESRRDDHGGRTCPRWHRRALRGHRLFACAYAEAARRWARRWERLTGGRAGEAGTLRGGSLAGLDD